MVKTSYNEEDENSAQRQTSVGFQPAGCMHTPKPEVGLEGAAVHPYPQPQKVLKFKRQKYRTAGY